MDIRILEKPARTWTFEEECAARDLLAASYPEPLSDEGLRLLLAICDAEEARLYRDGNADLSD